MEEVSGASGYPRRDITWTTVEGGEAVAFDPERVEAELVLKSLRKFASLFEDDAEA